MHEDEDQFASGDPSFDDLPELPDLPDAVAALPQWRVVLHDDEVHDRNEVIARLTETLPISRSAATRRVMQAHDAGVATLLHAHQELAELYYVRLSKQNLIVTIERQ